MITIHDNVEQGSDEWLTARSKKYTGSNAYKLLSSFGKGEHALAGISDFTGNFFTKRGHLLEDDAIDLYENINDIVVMRPGFVTNTDYPDCLYSPDGLTDDHLLEVKCFGNEPHLKIVNGTIPLKIQAQIHFGMMICGKQAARLIVYNPKLPPTQAYKCIDIAYNPMITKRFEKILTE